MTHIMQVEFRFYSQEHVLKCQAFVLDQPRAKGETGSISEEHTRLRYGVSYAFYMSGFAILAITENDYRNICNQRGR